MGTSLDESDFVFIDTIDGPITGYFIENSNSGFSNMGFTYDACYCQQTPIASIDPITDTALVGEYLYIDLSTVTLFDYSDYQSDWGSSYCQLTVTISDTSWVTAVDSQQLVASVSLTGDGFLGE